VDGQRQRRRGHRGADGQISDFTAGFFTPQVRIYSPSGTLLGSAVGTYGSEVAITNAPGSGTYGGGGRWLQRQLSGAGTYRLTLAKTGGPVVVSAGDTGGPLTNGVTNIGTIDFGDLDVWTVSANAGEAIVVRMGQTNDFTAGFFTPQVRIYSPSGTLLGSASARTDRKWRLPMPPAAGHIWWWWAMATTPTIPEPVRTG